VSRPLLTIAVPTYNRAGLLEQCLSQIVKQLDGSGMVELLVCNNASTDSTESVVARLQQQGHPITHVCHPTNLGAEKNVIQCFTRAHGRYLLVLADDDLVLDDVLPPLLRRLESEVFGAVFLTPYGFKQDHAAERPREAGKGTITYREPAEFLKQVGVWITFLSGNVVNKELLEERVQESEFDGTGLPQLAWILPAILGGPASLHMGHHCIAFKTENTGGYQLCKVFGENLDRILRAFLARGLPEESYRHIQRELLREFFPHLLCHLRRNATGFSFQAEDQFATLRRTFGGRLDFWLFTVPALTLPALPGRILTRTLARILP
jgi:abequosyltransferase